MKRCRRIMRKSSSFPRFPKTDRPRPTMKRDLEYKFFKEFQYDGAAIMSLEMMHLKYCGISNGTVSRPDYPDGVLAEIRERTEAFNTWPWSGVENCSPLMDEIADNLMTMQSDCRQMYAEELLCKMQTWIWLYSLSKEKLDAVSNSVVEFSVEMYFHEWKTAFRTFTEKLAVIFAKIGINILEIQNRCGITIIERLDVNDLWMDFGTPQLAEYHLSRLNESARVEVGFSDVRKSKKSQTKEEAEAYILTLLNGDTRTKSKTIELLHCYLDGKRGKQAALVVEACVKSKRMVKPTFSDLKLAFDLKGSHQSFNNYYGSFQTPKDKKELEEMIKVFNLSQY